MPITWITFLIGSLALCGTPLFSGFYSKDSIIDAVSASHLPGAGFASFAVTASVFVTALYSFRLYFLVFHGEERFRTAVSHHGHDDHGHDDHAAHGHDDHGHGHGSFEPKESPWVVTLPLVLLAIPSAVVGWFTIRPLLFGGFFQGAIVTDTAAHPAMADLAAHFHGPLQMALDSFAHLPLWLAIAGALVAYYAYMVNPRFPAVMLRMFKPVYVLLDHKYYMDWINEHVIAAGARLLGRGLWQGGDAGVIDGLLVNGTARLVGMGAALVRRLQTGFIYYYALAMIAGVVVFMWMFVPGKLLSGWFIR
jgi:NADH-quinone oxidoreductase subunit L